MAMAQFSSAGVVTLRVSGPKPGSFCKTGFSLQIDGRGLQAASLLIELLLMLSCRSKRAYNLPPCLLGMERVTALKTLGVTITGKLSMSEHVRDVVRKCAQSLHIIRVLRCRGMNDQALQAVYRSVVIGAKLLDAACA